MLLQKGFSYICTQGRSRTGTSVTSLVFETNASTNSATWASTSAVGTAKVEYDFLAYKF